MKKRSIFFKIAAITGYIFAFLHILLTAMFYSVGNGIYWMFLFFAAIALCNSLYTSTITQYNDEEDFQSRYKVKLLVNAGLHILSPISLVFVLLAAFLKEGDSEKEGGFAGDNQKTEKIAEEKENEHIKDEKPAKPWYKKASFILSCIGLGSVILSSFVAQMGETSFYTVTTNDFTLTKQMTEEFNAGDENALNGENFVIESDALSYSVTEYKPKSASLENPLPTIFVMPGFTRTKATMSQYAIELSRRGAVVFTLDPGCQGGTTYSGYDENGDMVSSTVGANGLDYLVQYVYNDAERFYYLDRNAFGAVGHSAGGGNVTTLAEDFAGNSYSESIIKAVYISGYIKLSAANKFINLRCNAALSYAYYDEGAFRYQSGVDAFEVVAQMFIDNVNGQDLQRDTYVLDQEYGSMADGTYRVIHKEDVNHCFQMYDPVSIGNTINFFRRSLSLNTELSDSSQTWFLKEGFNGLALCGAFLFIFACLAFVIDMVPWFKSFKEKAKEVKVLENRKKYVYGGASESVLALREGEEKPVRKKKLFADRLSFWIVMAITAIVACLDYIPLARLSMDWFPDAASNTYTFYFPARMMNAVMLWAFFNGTLGFILFFGVKAVENLVYKAIGKPDKVDWYRFKAFKIKWMDLLKTLVLAVGFFLVFYGLDQLIYLIFHQDFRFMLISAAPLQWRYVVTWFIYLLPFFVFYLSNSARVNLSVAQEGFKEWQVYLIGALSNSLGLVFILIINYTVYFTTGTVFYGYYSPTDTSEMWLYVNMIFGLIPMMALLPILNRFVYKKSGNIYLGAILCCMIFIMMSLSASVSYIPL